MSAEQLRNEPCFNFSSHLRKWVSTTLEAQNFCYQAGSGLEIPENQGCPYQKLVTSEIIEVGRGRIHHKDRWTTTQIKRRHYDRRDRFPSADAVRPWLERWRRRLAPQLTSATAKVMRAVNPIYIPRNHLVEEALTAAFDHADLTLFERLLDVIAHPYDERPGLEDYSQPAHREFTACYKTFCGT